MVERLTEAMVEIEGESLRPVTWVVIDEVKSGDWGKTMDIYHVWCNLKPGVKDTEFVQGLEHYLNNLKANQQLVGYRITRAKLGFKPPELREFHVTLDFLDLTQLQTAFDRVASRADPIESLHHAVNSKVQDVFFALYRDFPDKTRVHGQEKF